MLPNHLPIPELFVSAEAADALRDEARRLPRWTVGPRQLCDLDLLMNGGFFPLKGFLTQADYENVLTDMRLSSGHFWPVPVVLDVTEGFAAQVEPGSDIALCDSRNCVLAIMSVTDKWQPDKPEEARHVYGTDDPGVPDLLNSLGAIYLGGKVKGIEPPHHAGLGRLGRSPNSLRAQFREMSWTDVLAVHFDGPITKSDLDQAIPAGWSDDAGFLLHPVVGADFDGNEPAVANMDHDRLLASLPADAVHIAVLTLASRRNSSRDPLLQALVRRNHGATHFTMVSSRSQGRIKAQTALRLCAQHESDIGIKILTATGHES